MLGQRNNQVLRFGVADKYIGRDHTFNRVSPAQQRFNAIGFAVVCRYQRLILNVKLTAPDAEQDFTSRSLMQRQQQPADCGNQQRQQQAGQQRQRVIA